MTYSSKDWIKAISKLLEMTSKEEIVWSYCTEYDEDAWSVVDRAFEVNIGNLRYVIKESRYRRYTDEEEFYWANRVDFEIYKIEGKKSLRIASAPNLDILHRLYEMVESNFAYSQNALGALLVD